MGMEYSTIIASVITAGTTLFGMWVEKKYKERKKPDLSDHDYEDLLKPILGQIFEEFDADRINYMSFHNGEKTYDGYSLKNLSMMAEINKDGYQDILMDLQKIPAISFKRVISELRNEHKEDYIVSFETIKNDKLSSLYNGYHMKTIIACKIKNRTKKNPWTGILTIGFNEENKIITEEKLTWLSFQLNRVGELIATSMK